MGYTEYPSYGSESYALSLVKCGVIRRMLIRKEIQLYQFKPTYELGIYPMVGTKPYTMSPWAMFHYANQDIALVRMKVIAQLLSKYGIGSVVDIIGETMLGLEKSFLQIGTPKRNIVKIKLKPPFDPKLESVFVFLPDPTKSFNAQYGIRHK